MIDSKVWARQLTNSDWLQNISNCAFGSALAEAFFAGTVVIVGRLAVWKLFEITEGQALFLQGDMRDEDLSTLYQWGGM